MVNFMVDKMIDCSYEINVYALFFWSVYVIQLILVALSLYDPFGFIEKKSQFLFWITPFAIPVTIIKRFMELK